MDPPLTREMLAAAIDLALRSDAALHLVNVIQSGRSGGDVTRELAIRELEEESAAILSEASQEIARKRLYGSHSPGVGASRQCHRGACSRDQR